MLAEIMNPTDRVENEVQFDLIIDWKLYSKFNLFFN